MNPIPADRPLAPGVILPRRLPRHDVHIAISRAELGRCRYLATSNLGTWSAMVEARHPRVALVDAAHAVRRIVDPGTVVRVVARIPHQTEPWWLSADFEAHFPRLVIDREHDGDRRILDRLEADLDRQMRRATPAAPLTVATDGSVDKRALGFGWLAETGDHGVAAIPVRNHWQHSHRVLAAELSAVAAAVAAIPYRRVSFLIDSSTAVATLRRWQRGHRSDAHRIDAIADEFGPLATLRTAVVGTDRLDFQWIPGHRGIPLNEGADALAKLARLNQIGAISRDDLRSRTASVADAFAEYHRTSASTVDASDHSRVAVAA